jgi:hypothetical protein
LRIRREEELPVYERLALCASAPRRWAGSHPPAARARRAPVRNVAPDKAVASFGRLSRLREFAQTVSSVAPRAIGRGPHNAAELWRRLKKETFHGSPRVGDRAGHTLPPGGKGRYRKPATDSLRQDHSAAYDRRPSGLARPSNRLPTGSRTVGLPQREKPIEPARRQARVRRPRGSCAKSRLPQIRESRNNTGVQAMVDPSLGAFDPGSLRTPSLGCKLIQVEITRSSSHQGNVGQALRASKLRRRPRRCGSLKRP